MSQTLFLGENNSRCKSPAADRLNFGCNTDTLHLPQENPINQSCYHSSKHQCGSHNLNGTSITAGGCTHYHNHYEGWNTADKDLIRECFGQIGQSLAQLHEKDQIIQKLINTQQNSTSKNVELRRKLRKLNEATMKSM